MKSIISAFFKRELTYRFLYKTDLYIIILVPILNIISFYLLGKFANAFSYFDMDVSAIRFIVFSVLIFYFSWEIVNNIISSIVEQKKILMHYLETPATIYHMLIGSLFVGIIQSFLFMTIQLIILNDFMNLNLSIITFLFLIILMTLSLISFIGISLIISGLSIWIKRTNYLFEISRILTIIFSAVLYSPYVLPKIFQKLIYFFPPALYIEMSRQLILFEKKQFYKSKD